MTHESNAHRMAQGLLERRGLRPTPRLLSATIMALDKAKGQARTDPLAPVESVAQEAANHVVTKLGLAECIKIADENPGLAARRLLVPFLPKPPSVQDVASGIVGQTLEALACEIAVAIRSQQ